MARTVHDTNLSTRTARAKLKPTDKPYYRAIDTGLHLGYRKGKTSGRWVLRRYVGDGEYKVETLDGVADDTADADGVTTLSFAQAQALARKFHSERSAAALGRHVGPYTVKNAIDDYIKKLATKPRSEKEARYSANALILPALGDVEVAKLTADKIRDWHAALAKTPGRLRTKPGKKQRFRDTDDPEDARRRMSTANRILTVLKAALNHAFHEKKVSSDEEWRRVKAYRGVDVARVRYLKVAEATRLINACSDDLRKLVRGALLTGARYSELAAMQVHDFNPDAGTVHIRKSKSGKDRHVVLTDEGIALFKSLTTGRDGAASIFTKSDGTSWGRGHERRLLRDACRDAKIAPEIGFHGLRHTYASLTVMAGAPLIVVAKNLGHADTRMVEKHYGHLADSYVAETIRKTAPKFGGVEDSNVIAIEEARS